MTRQAFYQWVVVGLAFSWLPLGTSLAQEPPRRYRPYRPTLSRYLDYFRSYNNAAELGGALDPLGAPSYDGFVRPRFDLDQYLNRQSDRLQSLSNRVDQNVRTLRSEVEEVSGQQTIRQSPARATGIGAGFQNYSHYYSNRR